MKILLAMFIFIKDIEYPTMQKCGKHKRSRYYKDEYKTKFGVQP